MCSAEKAEMLVGDFGNGAVRQEEGGRGKPKRRYKDVINENMKLVGVSKADAEVKDRWGQMIRCVDP